MPIYEYECKECGHITSKYQPLPEPSVDDGGSFGMLCERCRGTAYRILSYVSHGTKHKGRP